MKISKDGRTYEIRKGSDVINDTVYLEMNDITEGNSINVFWGEINNDKEIRILSLHHKMSGAEDPLLLPLELVEQFIEELKNEREKQ